MKIIKIRVVILATSQTNQAKENNTTLLLSIILQYFKILFSFVATQQIASLCV